MSPSRVFLWLLLCFTAGVAFRSYFLTPFIIMALGIMAGAFFVALGLSHKNNSTLLCGFFSLALLAGLLRFEFAEQNRPEIESWLGAGRDLKGIVWEDGQRTENSRRLKVKIVSVDDRGVSPFYALVTSRPYPEYKIGDLLQIWGVPKAPEKFEDFDYPGYLAKEGIFSVVSFPQIEKTGERQGNKIKELLSVVKRRFEDQLQKTLPEPHLSYLKGLILGERTSLPKDLVENFNKTGTSHLVALSGYNITMVARFIITLLLLSAVPYRFSFWIASGAIILFVVLTGASSSAVRAGIMGILVLLAGQEGRMYRITNALVFAGAVMIWQNPLLLRFDQGFQLSFLATLGLIYLSPRLNDAWDRYFSKPTFGKKEKSSFLLSLKQTFLETLSAQIAVLPLLVFLFGRISIVSPLVNILVLSSVPYAMFFGFFSGILGFISIFPARMLSSFTWLLLEYQLGVINFFAGFSFSFINVSTWLAIPLTFLYAAAVWKYKKSKT